MRGYKKRPQRLDFENLDCKKVPIKTWPHLTNKKPDQNWILKTPYLEVRKRNTVELSQAWEIFC